MTPENLKALLDPVGKLITGRSLDDTLQRDLNESFPPAGKLYRAIFEACQVAIQAGWMCKHEAGGIRYGRVIKPAPDLHGYSVDVVDMTDVKGPHHRHPNGEIDLIMPVSPDAQFDHHGAGWLVYSAGSAHHPTVTQGRALVLYLLPNGAIEFTRT
jgi:hypothetical protein